MRARITFRVSHVHSERWVLRLPVQRFAGPTAVHHLFLRCYVVTFFFRSYELTLNEDKQNNDAGVIVEPSQNGHEGIAK
jgi:hypothetical protein